MPCLPGNTIGVVRDLFDYCEGELRKLVCHPKQHVLAKLEGGARRKTWTPSWNMGLKIGRNIKEGLSYNPA